MSAENSTPVTPKPSSTVMVIRPVEPGQPGFEVFMVRRSAKSRFMPDRYVFPGGRLEERDWQSATLERLHGFDPAASEPIFRDQPGIGAYDQRVSLSRQQEAGLYVAAFRELFEEAGVLLVVETATGQPLDMQADDRLVAHFAASRQLLHRNELDFITLLAQENLQLDMAGLIYFSHWITPQVEPYRFDTRFFLAAVPSNQLAESDYLETTEGVWITPRAALERSAAGEYNIAYPTLLHLEWLTRYPTVEEACQAARVKPVLTVMPNHYTSEAGELVFQIPEEVVDRW